MFSEVTDYGYYNADDYDGPSFKDIRTEAIVKGERYEYEKWPEIQSKAVESDNLLLSKFGVNASDGIYLCDDMEQQAFLLDAIKKDRISGLVPFKLLLKEGMLWYHRGPCGEPDSKLLLTPCWLSIGEMDHILCFTQSYDHQYDVMCRRYEVLLSGRKCLGNFQMSRVVDRILTDSLPRDRDEYEWLKEEEKVDEWLKEEEKLDEDGGGEVDGYDMTDHMMFRVNDKGQMVINERYFEHIMQRIREKDMVNFVMDRINETKYRFPQHKEAGGGDLCNDDEYGAFNLVVCSGFVHIDLRVDDKAVLRAKSILDEHLSPILSDFVLQYVPCCRTLSDWKTDLDVIECTDCTEEAAPETSNTGREAQIIRDAAVITFSV